MTWDKIKNFVFGGGAVVVLAVLVWYINITAAGSAAEAWKTEEVQLKLNAMIDEKLAALEVPSEATLTAQGGRIDINAAAIAENDQDIEQTTRRLEAVAEILMRPPDP